MTVSTQDYLRRQYDVTKAVGDVIVGSDATFEIEGHEAHYLLIKQFPWPQLSPQGEIERPMPMGLAKWQPQQVKINQQGPIAIFETKAGHVDALTLDLLRSGARFNAWLYEGTPERYVRAKRIEDAFIQLDSPDRDWENRSQPLVFSGTVFFHYLGETKDGTSY
jgi:hypothetical protein